MQSLLRMASPSIQIIPWSTMLWLYTISTPQLNRVCLSPLSHNEQTSQLNLGAYIFSRIMWLSRARARNMAFQGDEKFGILSSIVEIAFTFPSRWCGKGLVMTFNLVMLSNCISLLSMRSWIWYLNCTHSSKVFPSAPEWCSHYLDESKLGGGGSSLGFANSGH